MLIRLIHKIYPFLEFGICASGSEGVANTIKSSLNTIGPRFLYYHFLFESSSFLNN